MVEKIGHIKNPLTVIAIFAAIVEISGTTVLPFISPENQSVYIWFLMLFPALLITLFFLTLNYNHKVLYAPSDFKDESNFISLFEGLTPEEQEERLKEEISEIGDFDPECLSRERMSETNKFSSTAKYYLVEKLALNKISKEIGLSVKTAIKVPVGARQVIFDGIAVDNSAIHGIEVKIYRDAGHFKRVFGNIASEAEILSKQFSKIENKIFILHFAVIVDNPSAPLNEIEEELRRMSENYNVKISLHVYRYDDLINEYQYGP